FNFFDMYKVRYACCVVGVLSIIMGFSACSDLLELDPPKNQLTSSAVFSDSVSGTSAMNNIYYLFANSFNRNFNIYNSLYSDELAYTRSQSYTIEFGLNMVAPDNSWNQNTWSYLYQVIYSCNDLLEQCTDNEFLTESLIQQLTGEAKFLRCLAYFYLVNLYGDVPLLLQTDVVHNRQASRSGVNEIYAQVISDLI